MNVCVAFVFLWVISRFYFGASDITHRKAPDCTNPKLITCAEYQNYSLPGYCISINCILADLLLTAVPKLCNFFWTKVDKQGSGESSSNSNDRRVKVTRVGYIKSLKELNAENRANLLCQLHLSIDRLTPGSYKFAYQVNNDQDLFISPNAITLIAAEIRALRINGEVIDENQKIVVDEETNLTIICVAVGKPLPSVTIIKVVKFVEVPVDSTNVTFLSLQTASYVKMTSCRDSGKYSYIAGNGVALSRRDVWIVVRCALEPIHENEIQRRFNLAKGENATLHINLWGYPKPISYVLEKVTSSCRLEVKKVDVLVAKGSDKTSWQMSLTFYKVNIKDSGRYQFTIGNSVGKDLNYGFDVKVSRDKQPKDSESSSSLGTGAIVGLILASNVVVIVLIIASMISFRKLRKKSDLQKSNERGYGCTNAGLHKPKRELPNSGYVDDPTNAILPADFRTPTRNVPQQGVYEAVELQCTEDAEYEPVSVAEGESGRES